ncbi:MAG: chemotaxis response regulator protein-glutamate methylesterase [Oligoflexia bacterium]|nr:chemotaxis response regulator protein-glutamate methylesterase [Oligoflexia bacterium]
MNKKKVLIIDDSALIREILTEVINSFNNFEVIDTAADPHIGANKIVKLNPDIVTLDIEMPIMDGLTFLEKLMRLRPIPVLIISSLSKANSDVALKSLELGAVDYVTKPSAHIVKILPELREEIKSKLEICAISKISRERISRVEVEKKYSADAVLPVKKNIISFQTTEKIIAIGASTGGTVALTKLLSMLPGNMPGIVIVQHMPAGFTKAFATRLNCDTSLKVKEAEENDTIIAGHVLIAPGGQHLLVNRSGTRFFVKINDGPTVNRHKPSVDVLFRSVAQSAGANSVGVILTGMGDDGALGMLEMKQVGSFNLAQNEASSVVFGMPKVAIEKGGVDKVLSLEEIAKYLLNNYVTTHP